MELLEQLKQRFEEAGKDTAWAKKVREAATWEAYVQLLNEKDMEALAEWKEAFEAGKSRKTGELLDDELEKVAGGFGPIFTCPQKYDSFVCEWTNCPYKQHDKMFGGYFCKLGYWKKGCTISDASFLKIDDSSQQEKDLLNPYRLDMNQ